MGYVGKESLIFAGDPAAFNTLDKWVPKDSTIKFPFVAPRGMKLKGPNSMNVVISSPYNYPFSKECAANFVPSNVINAPMVSDSSLNLWLPSTFSYRGTDNYTFISPIGKEYGKINNTNPTPVAVPTTISKQTGDYYVQTEYLPVCVRGQIAHVHPQRVPV